MRAVIACVTVAVMLVALPVRARDPEKRVDFNFGSGATISTGEVNNHLTPCANAAQSFGERS